MLLTVSHDFLPKQNSTQASMVMDHFGIGFEKGKHVIAQDFELPIEPGDVVLFTGASGSGKSSLMRAASEHLCKTPNSGTLNSQPSTLNPVLNIDDLELGERILIDSLPLPVDESMQLLSSCGLGEAHLMLRTPAELSDGQRYRFRLALGLSQRPQWLVADEFTATLDRTLARIVAFNVRRLADRTGTGFLLATTHDDIAEDLHADVHVQCRLDGQIDVVRSDESADPIKKKTHVPRPRPLDQRGDQIRLAVFRSVALSQSCRRLHKVTDVVVAWARAGWCLCVCVAADLSQASQPVLRSVGAMGADVDSGDEPATCHALTSCCASDVSRGRCRSELCQAVM